MVVVFLPAYDESPSIGQLIEKIETTMTDAGIEFRILVVNDGSQDRTLEIVRSYEKKLPITIINHEVNRGLWETVRDGFEWAGENLSPDDVFIRMDGDDTHDPKYMPAMIEKINDGYDVVIASRFQPGGAAKGLDAYRTFISRSANMLMKGIFPIKGVWEYSCGYRAYRVSMIQKALDVFGNAFIDLKGVGFTCTIEKLIKFRMLGARFGEVPFVLRYDQKLSNSKMLSSITTLGYLVLMAKYIYPWGETGKMWQEKIDNYKE